VPRGEAGERTHHRPHRAPPDCPKREGDQEWLAGSNDGPTDVHPMIKTRLRQSPGVAGLPMAVGEIERLRPEA